MEPIKIYKREAYLIKREDLKEKTVEKLIKHNTHLFFEDRACSKCEWLEDRTQSETGLSEACEACDGFKGGVGLAKEMVIGKTPYVSLPIGDRKAMEKIINKDVVYKSKHEEHEFKRPIKFTGKLYDYQKEARKAIIKKKKGVIKAPPRSGKTVIATAAICKIGMKTIIVASQQEWLDGFYETFCGSASQKPLTDAKKRQVGFAKTLAQFEKYDVCLVTVQTFRSTKGQKLLKKIRDMFTVLFIDEVHYAAANKFATFISKINTKFKIGLSGTPSRKDGRFKLAKALVGPNIFEAKVERLVPTVRLVRTKYVKKYKHNPLWTTMVKDLESDPPRLKMIAEYAVKDAKDGHMVLIPMTRVASIKALTMAINRIAGKNIAREFHGTVKKPLRKQLILDARAYKIKVVVGSSKLISTGTNIPRASAIYDCVMSANKENAEQRVSRILTPYDGKPPPLLRIFMDEFSVRKSCLRTEWFNAIKPIFKPIISAKDEQILKIYLNAKVQDNHPDWER